MRRHQSRHTQNGNGFYTFTKEYTIFLHSHTEQNHKVAVGCAQTATLLLLTKKKDLKPRSKYNIMHNTYHQNFGPSVKWMYYHIVLYAYTAFACSDWSMLLFKSMCLCSCAGMPTLHYGFMLSCTESKSSSLEAGSELTDVSTKRFFPKPCSQTTSQSTRETAGTQILCDKSGNHLHHAIQNHRDETFPDDQQLSGLQVPPDLWLIDPQSNCMWTAFAQNLRFSRLVH